jgi:hypothetical protein
VHCLAYGLGRVAEDEVVATTQHGEGPQMVIDVPDEEQQETLGSCAGYSSVVNDELVATMSYGEDQGVTNDEREPEMLDSYEKDSLKATYESREVEYVAKQVQLLTQDDHMEMANVEVVHQMGDVYDLDERQPEQASGLREDEREVEPRALDDSVEQDVQSEVEVERLEDPAVRAGG